MSRPRLLVLGLSLLLVVSACGGDDSGGAANEDGTGVTAGGGSDCPQGLGEFEGAQTRTFCGPATATVDAGGTTYEFAGGVCDIGDKYLTLNIGTLVIDAVPEGTKKPAYFGLVAGDVSEAAGGGIFGSEGDKPLSSDGLYTGEPIVTWVSGTVADSLGTGAKLKVSQGRSKGTFAGDVLIGEGSATGSFSCG